MGAYDTLDKTKVNMKLSEAIGNLENALIYITYAKDEINSEFSGSSFDVYQKVLDDLYTSISGIKNQLENLYR